MSQLSVSSTADRATSSKYVLGSLVGEILDQGPHDNESLPLEPAVHELAGDANDALREDTARRLSELLERPGVNGTLIDDLLSYHIEDHVNRDEKDPNYVAR